MAESFQKIGRGGAGNYRSKKDLEDAQKVSQQEKDIEAQHQDPPLTRTPTSQTEYSKIGRGGAGNVVSTSEAEAAGSELARVTTSRTLNRTVSGTTGVTPAYQGHGGRGGAGNWRGNAEEERKVREAEEESARREVEKRVQDEVLRSLRAPEKAYYAAKEEKE